MDVPREQTGRAGFVGAPNLACAKNAGASDAELIILCLMGGSRRKDAYSASLLSFNTLAAGGEATLSFSRSLRPALALLSLSLLLLARSRHRTRHERQ